MWVCEPNRVMLTVGLSPPFSVDTVNARLRPQHLAGARSPLSARPAHGCCSHSGSHSLPYLHIGHRRLPDPMCWIKIREDSPSFAIMAILLVCGPLKHLNTDFFGALDHIGPPNFPGTATAHIRVGKHAVNKVNKKHIQLRVYTHIYICICQRTTCACQANSFA